MALSLVEFQKERNHTGSKSLQIGSVIEKMCDPRSQKQSLFLFGSQGLPDSQDTVFCPGVDLRRITGALLLLAASLTPSTFGPPLPVLLGMLRSCPRTQEAPHVRDGVLLLYACYCQGTNAL